MTVERGRISPLGHESPDIYNKNRLHRWYLYICAYIYTHIHMYVTIIKLKEAINLRVRVHQRSWREGTWKGMEDGKG